MCDKIGLEAKFALPLLPVYEVKLFLLVFVKIALLCRFIYHFIVNNRSVQIIDKVGGII